ncbi:MAG: enoyl-CoA hydratase-related protein [Acidimicrobiia bacterium]
MTEAQQDLVLVEDRDGARLITFNRPSAANAFNEPLYHASAQALRDAAADDSVACVVLTGAGKVFSAGTDLVEMAAGIPEDEGGELGNPDRDQNVEPGFVAFVDFLAVFPKPVIAAVNGAGVGLGFTMLAHCDIVLVSERAKLLAPFAQMGVAPEAASSYLFPRRMNRQYAALALYTSDWVSADDAVASGLALKKCSADTLVDEAMAIAQRIAAHPVPSLVATKRLLIDSERDAVDRARGLENDAFSELLRLSGAKDKVLNQLDGDKGAAPGGDK